MEGINAKLRKRILELSYRCQDGNLQSAFSCIDVIWVLYDKIMNWSRDNARYDNRDFFIISKGQATLALYAVLIEKGLFEQEEVYEGIGQFDSRYCIQTDMTKFEGGIENNAGSLGHGLPFAVGIAHANIIKGLESKTYVLCGDGEFCEGTMWESCIFAASHGLSNLCVIIDDNDSAGAMVDLRNLFERLVSFGFYVVQVNGHNIQELEKTLKSFSDNTNDRPTAIITRTVRGYGSQTMIDNDIWFHKAPNEQELAMLIQEVESF